MKRLAILTTVLLSWCLFKAEAGWNEAPEYIEPPRLVSPAKGVVDLTGKDVLEFRWMSYLEHYNGVDYFDFKLYRGNKPESMNLVYQEKVQNHRYALKVKADLLKDGETYTWFLRHVISVEKSDARTATFKIIKK